MGETKALYSLLMLALVFNIVMYGVMDYVSASGLDDIDCELNDITYTGVNASELQSEDVRAFSQGCQPAGLPFWFYAIWGIINIGVVYAFIPFVK